MAYDEQLLTRKPYEPKVDFSVENEIITSNTERIEDLAAIEKQRLERQVIASETLRKAKEEAIREA